MLVLPSTLVHEAGHAAVCLAENPAADWTLEISADGASGSCPGIRNLAPFYASGGLAASAAALGAAALPQVRRRRALLAAALTTAAWQLLTAAVETLAHEWYILTDAWAWLLPAALVAGPALLCPRRRPT